MDEHVETLRKLQARCRFDATQHHASGCHRASNQADHVADALGSAIEALERPRWQDAPDGDGMYWVACGRVVMAVRVRDDMACPLVGSFREVVCNEWERLEDLHEEASARGHRLLWSRIPDPSPVPADDAITTPTPSPDACNLPLRWPHIGPDETCEQCGQRAQAHRHWHGEEVRHD